jgi:EmrB/QacA subfamily drug resistance transporter
MMFALALVVSAVASLNVALPDIAQGSGATQTQLQWIVDGYAVVFAGLLLPAGAFGDRFGRRRALAGGLIIFGLAYAAAAFVTGPDLLVVCRACAGVGAALVMPATLSIITNAFPPAARAKAVGTWAGVAGGGAVIGLLLSGFLVEYSSWRWVFAANAIWALCALLIAAMWAPESRGEEQAAVDPIGAMLSAGGLSALVFATIEGPHRGWTDMLVVGGYVLGTLALVGFFRWESQRARPLLDPRVFRNRGFANGSLSISLQFLAFFGFVFIGMQYLQLVLGYSPVTAAFALLPMAITLGVLSRQVAPRLMQRFGGTRVDSIGLAVAALGCCALARLDAASSYWTVLAGLLILGTGMGLAMTPSTTGIVSALPAAKQGVASAVNDTSREVGGAVGIAVLGSLLTAGYQSGIDAHLDGMPPVVRTHARDSLAFVVQAAGRFGPAGQDLMRVARDSFVTGMHTAMWVAAALLAAAAVVTYLRRELLVDGDRGRSRDETHVPSLTTVDEATRRAS